MKKSVADTNQDRLDFLKARFEYCKDLFYKIEENNDKLENKMKFLTSFMVIFLSAIILNISSLEKLESTISLKSNFVLNTALRSDYILITVFFLASVFCVFMAIKIRTYDELYPQNFSLKFLFPGTDFFINEDEEVTNLKDEKILNSFYYSMTKQIIHAIDNNSQILKRKAKWFHFSWIALLCSIFLICISLIIVLFY